MALTIIPTCDICGKPKGETNNWFIAFRNVRAKLQGLARFAIYDWTPSKAGIKNSVHICGEGCLSTFVSRELANRTANKEVHTCQE